MAGLSFWRGASFRAKGFRCRSCPDSLRSPRPICQQYATQSRDWKQFSTKTRYLTAWIISDIVVRPYSLTQFAWNFSQSFVVIHDVRDANNDSKSFIDIVIWCRQGNKRQWAKGDNMSNKSWTQTGLLKIWMHQSSNADTNRMCPMVHLFLSGTVVGATNIEEKQ